MELGSSGFSMVGSRSLLLTDHPAVYVHDTGGFGSAFVTALEPAADPGATFELTDASTRLVADVQRPELADTGCRCGGRRRRWGGRGTRRQCAGRRSASR
jgi:hypothetical protein